MHRQLTLAALLFCGFTSAAPIGAEAREVVIASPAGASGLETLAAREVLRYAYLRTGRLLEIVGDGGIGDASAIVVARKDRDVVSSFLEGESLRSAASSLGEYEYLLETVERPGGAKALLAVGGGDAGTLYAAYRLAERWGARFYLHGDVLPDERIGLDLSGIHEIGKPIFDVRGIQPFHDFPEGPDWWNVDEYRAIISQLPKLRMNFIALHTYPEAGPCAEPTVWIGPPSEIGEGTEVKASYPSSYQNTLRGNWGYSRKETGKFSCGSDQLFERDAFGAEVMFDMCPQPEKPEESNELFRRTGDLLRRAFLHASRLGVKTCVGTETPLTVPARVKERLKEAGKDPADPAVIGEIYEGIFRRAEKAYPLDYYWFWTPEGWTWEGASSDKVTSTIKDLNLAIEAWKRADVSFRLATCGWVLGPQDDRAFFDKVLAPGIAVSTINREVGNTPVDPAFARISGRPRWAIPWLEDDPGLTSPQLWVGRMRRDAADARRYGCTGLLGIHWRTRVLAPNVLALAQAAWNQDGWNRTPGKPAEPEKVAGPVGGQMAPFPGASIEGTEDDVLYQTVRYNVSAYRFPVPDGKYAVTLKFCEPHYNDLGKRVFGVKIQGKDVIDQLDIFAKVGKNKALDYPFEDVEVAGGWLEIEFVPRVEYPSIAAIAIQGKDKVWKVNCGGPAYQDYAADWPAAAPSKGYLPTEDFYRDWALHEFGPQAGPAAAKIFVTIDGAVPRTSDWVDGPGGLRPDERSWEEARKEFAFVDELAALRDEVKGAGNLERFDYWLRTFRYTKAMGRVRCLWAQCRKAMEKVNVEAEPAAKVKLARETALPLHVDLVKAVKEVYEHSLSIVSNSGELGTVANWEQHILPSLLEKPGEELAKALGEALPAEGRLPAQYDGPTRAIVPAPRTSADEGEVLELKVIILSKGDAGAQPGARATLRWRPLGSGDFKEVPLTLVARGVHVARFPPDGARGDAIEYHVKVVDAAGGTLFFPATAPAMNQTVVVTPALEKRL